MSTMYAAPPGKHILRNGCRCVCRILMVTCMSIYRDIKNCIYLDEDAFVMLYKRSVRSHVEYAKSVWNPQRLGLITDLEKVQMRASKLVINMKNLT